MTVNHKLLPVSTTPVHLTNWNVLRSRSAVIIKNISFANVYIGNASVTTSNYGFRLLPEQTLSVELAPYDELYGVSPDSAEVSILVVED